MRVLFDATAIPAQRGGVGRYVDELIPELCRAGIDLVVVCQNRDQDFFASQNVASGVLPISACYQSAPARIAWEQTGFPALIRRLSPDVVHSPHYTMPLPTHTPVVVTLHDATFFSLPQVHTSTKARFFRTATRIASCRAAALVADSAATKAEVVRYTRADPNKIFVAHLGVDTARFHPVSPDEVARVRATLNLPEGTPYVGFLGTLEPRKNVSALIAAWVTACAHVPTGVVPPALVLAGGVGWDSAIAAALAAVPEDLIVRTPGYLPMADLAGFLAGAQVVAYPSLGEGFGLPVLEAMACGACVLTTRRLSLPEVGGDAVAYCDVDVESIAAALGELWGDPQRRTTLGAAAQSRAGTFTWAATAQATVRAYEAALRPAAHS